MGKELKIFAEAQNLVSYVGHITEKMPKKYRQTFYQRFNNLAFDYLSHLVNANTMNYVTSVAPYPVYAVRRNEQYAAMSSLRIIEQLLLVAKVNGDVITEHQHEVLGTHLYNNVKLLVSWGKSDKKRFVEMCGMSPEELKKFDKFLESLQLLKLFDK